MNGQKEYLVLTNSEDGDVRLRVVGEEALVEELREDEPDWNEFVTVKDIHDRGPGGWDFANEGKRGSLIVRVDGVVIPKPVQAVTDWRLS